MVPEPRMGVCVVPSARVTWEDGSDQGWNDVNRDLFVMRVWVVPESIRSLVCDAL